MTDQSPEQIQAQIEQQREQLAGTVDALAHKLDVKTQAQQKVSQATQQAKAGATTDEGRPRPELVAAGVLAVAAVVAVVWYRHRR